MLEALSPSWPSPGWCRWSGQVFQKHNRTSARQRGFSRLRLMHSEYLFIEHVDAGRSILLKVKLKFFLLLLNCQTWGARRSGWWLRPLRPPCSRRSRRGNKKWDILWLLPTTIAPGGKDAVGGYRSVEHTFGHVVKWFIFMLQLCWIPWSPGLEEPQRKRWGRCQEGFCWVSENFPRIADAPTKRQRVEAGFPQDRRFSDKWRTVQFHKLPVSPVSRCERFKDSVKILKGKSETDRSSLTADCYRRRPTVNNVMKVLESEGWKASQPSARYVVFPVNNLFLWFSSQRLLSTNKCFTHWLCSCVGRDEAYNSFFLWCYCQNAESRSMLPKLY